MGVLTPLFIFNLKLGFYCIKVCHDAQYSHHTCFSLFVECVVDGGGKKDVNTLSGVAAETTKG